MTRWQGTSRPIGFRPTAAADRPRRPGPADRPGEPAVAGHLAPRDPADPVEDESIPVRQAVQRDRAGRRDAAGRPRDRPRRPPPPHRAGAGPPVRRSVPRRLAEPSPDRAANASGGRQHLERDDAVGVGGDVDRTPGRLDRGRSRSSTASTSCRDHSAGLSRQPYRGDPGAGAPDRRGILPGSMKTSHPSADRPPRAPVRVARRTGRIALPIAGMTCASCVNRIERFLDQDARASRRRRSTWPPRSPRSATSPTSPAGPSWSARSRRPATS